MIEWSDNPKTAPEGYDLCGKWHGLYVDIMLHDNDPDPWHLVFGCGTKLHKTVGHFKTREAALECAEVLWCE